MTSVPERLLALIKLSGLALEEKRSDDRPSLARGAIDVSYAVPFPVRWLKAHRSRSGTLIVDVPQGQSLAIDLIQAFGVNFSATSTIAVRNSSDTMAQNAQPLQTVIGTPTLYVFAPGKAIFDFVFTALPLVTARVEIQGFRLPRAAYTKLGVIATEQLAQ